MHTQKERNFAVFTQLEGDLLLRILRCYFRRCWNSRYPEYPWGDSSRDGELLLNGSMQFSRKFPGVAKLEEGCAKVNTSEDLSTSLQQGDLVQIRKSAEEHICAVVSVGPSSLATDVTWSQAGNAEIYGPFIQPERKLHRGETHQRTKILSGNSEEWKLGILAFVLTESSHSLMRSGNARAAKPVVKELVRTCQSLRLSFEIEASDVTKITELILKFVDLCIPDQREDCLQEIQAAQATLAEESETAQVTRSNVTSILCQLTGQTDWNAEAAHMSPLAAKMKKMGLVESDLNK